MTNPNEPPMKREDQVNDGAVRITQVAVPGGSGVIPTGALQFKQDWPGLFIRGDDAIGVAAAIRQLQQRLNDADDVAIWRALHRLNEYADIIERDVIVS